MRLHRTHVAGHGLALLLACAGVACGGANGRPRAPANAAATTATPGTVPGSAGAMSGAEEGRAGSSLEQQNPGSTGGESEAGDAELIISREVVARCPILRLVREHVDEFDPEMVWLAVLESIADCMGEGGTMSTQNIRVSGDEEHRHVVREVLGARGISPTRVVAAQPPVEGAAECQGGGTDCHRRVEITLTGP